MLFVRVFNISVYCTGLSLLSNSAIKVPVTKAHDCGYGASDPPYEDLLDLLAGDDAARQRHRRRFLPHTGLVNTHLGSARTTIEAGMVEAEIAQLKIKYFSLSTASFAASKT